MPGTNSTLAIAPPGLVDLLPRRQLKAAPQAHVATAYVRAAFASEIKAVQQSADGTRNAQLNKSAYALGQFVGSGLLDRATVEQDLEGAALLCGLSENEARATIKSGLDKGEMQPRSIPEAKSKRNGTTSSSAPAKDDGANIVLNLNPCPLSEKYLDTLCKHGSDLKLRRWRGEFYWWTGQYYQRMTDEAICSALYRFLETLSLKTEDGSRPVNPKAALVREMLLALPSRGLLVDELTPAPSWLTDNDLDPRLVISCRNGLLDPSTMTLHPASPALFNLCGVNCDYNPEAPFPSAWIKFLTDLWGDDQESVELLQEWMGLVHTLETRYQKILTVIGPPRSGKGTIFRVIKGTLGEGAICNPTLAAFAEPFGVQTLIGKALAVISDARLGGRPDASVIAERLLSFSGEDPMTIQRKFLPDWTGRLTTRFAIISNEAPRIPDQSGAFSSRLLVLRLTKSFLGKEDLYLEERLLAEKDSIFMWALEGLKRLCERGRFIQPQSSADLIESIEDLTSPVRAFIKDRCRIDFLAEVATKDLFTAWQTWNKEHGRDNAGTEQVFGRDLRAALPNLQIKRHRLGGEIIRFWTGIALQGCDAL